MKIETLNMMNEMIAHAKAGHPVIPIFFQPRRGGISNTVSAAIRCAKARGLLVDDGLDGCGNPQYCAPAAVIPTATHAAPASRN